MFQTSESFYCKNYLVKDNISNYGKISFGIIRNTIDNDDINFYHYREKSKDSIAEKMTRQGKRKEQIYDKYAMRIICNDIDQCYELKQKIANNWFVIPMTQDDYIADPKANGYQALHLALNLYHANIEVQIKTPAMYDTAEYGSASEYKKK